MDRLANVHPGDVLREDYLVPLGMIPYRLAKELGMPQIAVSQILKGERAVTAATALRLERFFGVSAQFWLNLKAAYDLEEAEARMGEALGRIRRFERFEAPVPDAPTPPPASSPLLDR